MRAERLIRNFSHSKSLAFCILVEKYNQYKKGSLSFGREVKFQLPNLALRIAKPLPATTAELTQAHKSEFKKFKITSDF